MNRIIIRCFKKDELNALLCYQSMKRVGIEGEYYFHYDNELGPPVEIIKTGEKIINRSPCGNYGGLTNMKINMKDLQQLPAFDDRDLIVYADADVVMLENPLPRITDDIDHAGHGGEAKVYGDIVHVSGQLNIVRGWLWNKYIAGGEKNLVDCWGLMDTNKAVAGCADDTLFSIYAYIQKAKQLFFKCWIHDRYSEEKCRQLIT